MLKKGLLTILLLVLAGILFNHYKHIILPYAGEAMLELDRTKPTGDIGLDVDPHTRNDLLVLLRARKFTDLDQRLEKFAVDFDSGKINEFSLDYLFDGFNVTDPSLEPLFMEWVATTGSWAANLAGSRFFDSLSWQWRGGAFAYLVPEQNMQKFAQLQQVAAKFLSDARQDNHRDSIWYASRIEIANQGNGDELAIIKEALAKFPKSEIVYRRSIHAQQSKWGGDKFKHQELIHDFGELMDGANHDDGPSSYYYEAVAAANDKDYTTAVRVLNTAIEKNPNRVLYYSDLAKYHFKLEQYQKALSAANTVLKYWPISRVNLERRANIFVKLGQLDKAQIDIEALLKHSPYHRNGNLAAIAVYAKQGNREQALKAIERASYFTEYDAEQWNRLGYQARYNMKDSKLAEGLYKKSLQVNPLDSGGHYNLATLYGDRESCEIVKHIHGYLTGCQQGAGRAKYWCGSRFKDWAYSAINHLKDHQRCAEINDYDFSRL